MNIMRFVWATLLTAALLSSAGCGNSVEGAFANCVAIAEKQTQSGGKGNLPPDMAKLFEKAARGMAEKQCSIIRDECRDPQSETCQRLIQQYSKK
jgi:hypothetical protein